MGYTYERDGNNVWHYYDSTGREISTIEVSQLILGKKIIFEPKQNFQLNTIYDNKTEGEQVMPAFQVVVVQKVVKKVDSAGNEMTTVERVLVDKRVYAQNPFGAAVIAGMELDKDTTDKEVLASNTTIITVNQTN